MTTTPEQLTQEETIASLGTYGYGWADSDIAGAAATRGLNEAVVRDISAKKNEPEWMLDFRLKALRIFDKKPMPRWGSDLEGIDFDNIKYFVRSTEKQATSWEELPEDIKNTYDRLGIPETLSIAFAVMLGAAIGTTVAAQVLSFDLGWASPLMIGAGVIGLELGMVYQKFGSALTVVEATPSLLPGMRVDVFFKADNTVQTAPAATPETR